jgi:ribosomal protein L12E/L44/L45/RPP1/RPP2
MKRTSLIALVPLLVLAACDSSDATKTTVKMDAVEVQPGTISDDMIILDNSDVDGTAVDNSVPVDPAAKAAAEAKAKASGEKTEGDTAAKAEDKPEPAEAPAAEEDDAGN